jgi:hypothetical protein
MMTVIDQAKPWLMPSSAFAATIQPHVGPHPSMIGPSQPTEHQHVLAAVNVREMPGDEIRKRLDDAMNDTMIVVEAFLNTFAPRSGTTVRSAPTMPPTNALVATSSANCRQFSRRPSRTMAESASFDLADMIF